MNNSPRILDSDDSYLAVFPHEARIRSLTYSTEIYVDVQMRKLELESMDKAVYSKETGEKREPKILRVIEDHNMARVLIGRCPVMVRSKFCHLTSLNDLEITKDAKECVYD